MCSLEIYGANKNCNELISEIYNSLSSSRSPKINLAKSQSLYSALRPLSGRSIDISERLLIEKVKTVSKVSKVSSNDVYLLELDNGVKAIWKPHKEVETSNYRTEVLAYELSKLFRFDIVPPTIERELYGTKGSLQLFANSSNSKSLNEGEYYLQQLFDYIIDNKDRALSHNYLVSPTGKVISIDNGMSMTGMRVGTKHNVRDIFDELKLFFSKEPGSKIYTSLKESLTSESFHKEVKDYLGDENDALNLIDRIRLLLSFADFENGDYKDFLTQIVEDDTYGDFSLGTLAKLVDDSADLQKLIDAQNAKDYTLMSVGNTIRELNLHPFESNQLLVNILESSNSGKHALQSVAYTLAESKSFLSSTKYLLDSIVMSMHADANVIDFVSYALFKKSDQLGLDFVLNIIQNINKDSLSDYSSRKLRETINNLKE